MSSSLLLKRNDSSINLGNFSSIFKYLLILAFNQNIDKNGSPFENVNTCSDNLKLILSLIALLRAGSVVYLLCTTNENMMMKCDQISNTNFIWNILWNLYEVPFRRIWTIYIFLFLFTFKPKLFFFWIKNWWTKRSSEKFTLRNCLEQLILNYKI